MCALLSMRLQEAIGAAGGLRVVVEAMRHNLQIELCQDYGSYALQHLVKDHAANMVRSHFPSPFCVPFFVSPWADVAMLARETGEDDGETQRESKIWEI